MNRASITDLQLLKALVSVSECGSFTVAARRLNLTQSTVSQQIRRLEGQVGRALFTRHTRSVTLTEDGQILRGYAMRLLEISEEAMASLAVPTLSGKLSIGASDDIATHILPTLLRRFRKLHEQVHLEVRIGLTADLRSDLENGLLDVLLGKSIAAEANTDGVSHDQLVWVGDPALVEANDKPLPLALYPDPGCVYRGAATDALNRCGRSWVPAMTSPSLSGILAAVEAGIAVSPLAERFACGFNILNSGARGLPELPKIEFPVLASKVTQNPAVTSYFANLADETMSNFATG